MAKGGDVAQLHLNSVIENSVIGHSMYHIAQIKKRSDLWDKPGRYRRPKSSASAMRRGYASGGLSAPCTALKNRSP
jgi:hypothetical protein